MSGREIWDTAETLGDGISPRIAVNTRRRPNNEICSAVTCLPRLALAAKAAAEQPAQRHAVPKVASGGAGTSERFLSLVADNFTFSPPRQRFK